MTSKSSCLHGRNALVLASLSRRVYTVRMMLSSIIRCMVRDGRIARGGWQLRRALDIVARSGQLRHDSATASWLVGSFRSERAEAGKPRGGAGRRAEQQPLRLLLGAAAQAD